MKLKLILLLLLLIFIIFIKCNYKCKETYLNQPHKNKLEIDNINEFIKNLNDAFCLKNNKMNGILISILNVDDGTNHLYIDGSGSIFSNFSEGSRKLYGSNERIGLIWEPNDVIRFASNKNCMYPNDGATAQRIITSGELDRCADIPGQSPIPIMCNNTNKCIQDALKKQESNCNTDMPCNYNEFVLDRTLNTVYIKDKEKVKYDVYPSALTYVIPDKFYKYNYEEDLTKMSYSFTEDTPIIIIILNKNNYPTFDNTTVKDFKNYFSNDKQEYIDKILDQSNNIC